MDRRVRWVAVGVGLLVVARMAGWRRPAAARVLRVRVRPAEEPPDGETGAREHCALDPRTVGRVGGLGGQVLVRRDGVAGAYALFTVTDDYAARASARECRVAPAGLARLSQDPPGAFEARVEPTVTRVGEFEEFLSGRPNARRLAILAPHGGDIEPGTAEQARALEAALAGRGVRSWVCEGHRLPGDPAGAARRRWHVTSVDIADRSFPKLAALGRTRFDHAVAFHGRAEPGIGVGGGADEPLKRRIRDAIRRQELVDVDPAEIEVVPPSGDLSGRDPRNVVNRVTAGGDGIQLEQSAAARREPNRSAVVRAVAEVYRRLI